MKIVQEETAEKTLIVTVNVAPEDYTKQVDDLLKKYQRTAQMPGFRPGKVPSGVIKKMYGKSALVDELNKILSDSLEKYVADNKIETIGNPIPLSSDKELVFENGQSFEFRYEMGLLPQFELNISEKDVLPFFVVKVEDKMIEDDIMDLRRRHGKFSNPETSEDDNILYGEFEELENGEVKPEGNKTTTTLALEMIKDVIERKRFVGLKKGEQVTFNPMTVLGNEAEVAAMLKVDKNSPAMNADYRFTVNTINKVEKAELDQEFFNKAMGEGVVSSEEEFRQKIKEKIEGYFKYDTDRKLKKDLKNFLLENVSISLPEDFLKRLLVNSMEQKPDDHALEHEFFHFNEDLRWDLIKQKVVRENNLSVTAQEIFDLSAQLVRSQFARYGIYEVEEGRLQELATEYLKKDDNRRSLERTLFEEKVLEHLKTKIHLNTSELPYEDFMSKMLEKTEHEAEHHHH